MLYQWLPLQESLFFPSPAHPALLGSEHKSWRHHLLVKTETGITAQDFIADAIVTRAKELLNESSFTVSQVAYTLGFGYPQHFVRFFKRKTGKTPTEYRGAA